MGDRSEERTIQEEDVVKKYKKAGEIANKALSFVMEKCKPGASLRQACVDGDSLVQEEVDKVYKKEKGIKKGIAFPTCISVNNCICHFSPLPSEADYTFEDGDLVKIDMGCHIDGFIAVVAHVFVIGATPENRVKGRKADVILAAHFASEAAFELVKPGNETFSVTNAINRVAEKFDCRPVEGMLSHELKQFRIDGEKTIIQNPTDAQRKEQEKFKFEENDVFGIDVMIASGEGKPKDIGTRVTVFKKTDDIYSLKLKTSRLVFKEVVAKFGPMPFNLRYLEDEKKAKMGVIECVNHKIFESFPVLYEKPGEFVSQFKFTVLLTESGPVKITGLPFQKELYESEHNLDVDELQKLLSQSLEIRNVPRKRAETNTTAAITGTVASASVQDSTSADKQQQKQAPPEQVHELHSQNAESKLISPPSSSSSPAVSVLTGVSVTNSLAAT